MADVILFMRGLGAQSTSSPGVLAERGPTGSHEGVYRQESSSTTTYTGPWNRNREYCSGRSSSWTGFLRGIKLILTPGSIIRYEDLVDSGGLALFHLLGHSRAQFVILKNQNSNALYDTGDDPYLIGGAAENWWRLDAILQFPRIANGWRTEYDMSGERAGRANRRQSLVGGIFHTSMCA